MIMKQESEAAKQTSAVLLHTSSFLLPETTPPSLPALLDPVPPLLSSHYSNRGADREIVKVKCRNSVHESNLGYYLTATTGKQEIASAL